MRDPIFCEVCLHPSRCGDAKYESGVPMVVRRKMLRVKSFAGLLTPSSRITAAREFRTDIRLRQL